MNAVICIAPLRSPTGTARHLPSSKSISNRALICHALGGHQSTLHNLSAARDTRLMQALVTSPSEVIDVMDAGTTMRFLTAYFAATNQPKIITGTARMKERPIALLVDALRKLGARIDYLEKEGYPPLHIRGFDRQQSRALSIAGNVSSQYISALMMIGPTLPLGLELTLTAPVTSVPYIQMTVELMKTFGLAVHFDRTQVMVEPQPYRATTLTIEADWSAASYWFAFVALSGQATIHLPHVTRKSWQGDVAIVDIMELLGVNARFDDQGATLTPKNHLPRLEWNFVDCPDLAQTVLPVCAAKGISGQFTGLESLRIKETDRLVALQTELAKIGAVLREETAGVWVLSPGKLSAPVTIATYHDHRMAMGFAPWACLTEVSIEQPEVVDKSYPGFWEDMKSVGFSLA
ncbi:MAG: 3-phosphoshikimate 1-carboxyvinyltransferase [Cyclobacteriaceae bacterium]|nr:3-phosphoshikimate 1-carboxyvinyltransferase [Cyclobacteriaceae bacterium]